MRALLWFMLLCAAAAGAQAETVTLGGIEFQVQQGRARTLFSHATVQDAAACEQRTLTVVAELENQYGEFREPAPLADSESRVRAGKASHVVVSAMDARFRPVRREKALRRDPEKFWVRSQHFAAGAEDSDVRIGADYERAGRICAIEIRIDGPAPPPRPAVAVTAEQIVARPTISYRNRTLRKTGVPTETLHFTVPCVADAKTGAITMCLRDGDKSDPYRVLAIDWAMHSRIALENTVQVENLRVDVPVEIGPADSRTPNLSSGRQLDLAQVRVKRQHLGIPISIPGLKTRTEVGVICEVMEDGSLVCAAKPDAAVPAAAAAAAVDVAEEMELHLTLRDGTSAVGGLIERKLIFNPRP